MSSLFFGGGGRLSSSDLLGSDGPFASRVEGYRVRPGQRQVAEAVERILGEDGSLLCEAGTGIGKTFAYLVPAILSGRRVVISTATKNLQDQIAHRDLPLVQEVLGTEVPVAVMKGLGNYLCRRRYKEFLLSTEAMRPAYASNLRLLGSWVGKTEVGDLSELASLSDHANERRYVASSSETRVGSTCPYYDECFVTEMKRHAESAQIVIVNHHLFFADLAMRGPHPGRVLPDYDAVILDEAHQIEDTAAIFFGMRLSRTQMNRTFSEIARLLARQAKLAVRTKGEFPLLQAAHAASERFFSAVSGGSSPRRVLSSRDWKSQIASRGVELDVALSDLGALLQLLADSTDDDQLLREGLAQAKRRSEQLCETLRKLQEDDDKRVRWTETVDGKTSVNSTPVDLSQTLRERLFESVPAVVLLSATLSTGAKEGKSGFSFLRSRLGIGDEVDVEELSVPSPFSFASHCALYLPRDLPPPGAADFLDKAAERIAELVEMVEGGAFVLTTSLSTMKGLHERLARRLSARLLLIQGERPKDALISTFRANGAAVLVATSSFWEGVDVPGEALRLVVLEKVPFSVPTDPVFQARGRALEESGKSAFAHLALPGAALALKQGFGRLIRRETDVGIVALLDERVHTKSYGQALLSALPPARRTSELGELREFVHSWRSLTGEAPPSGSSQTDSLQPLI